MLSSSYSTLSIISSSFEIDTGFIFYYSFVYLAGTLYFEVEEDLGAIPEELGLARLLAEVKPLPAGLGLGYGYFTSSRGALEDGLEEVIFYLGTMRPAGPVSIPPLGL